MTCCALAAVLAGCSSSAPKQDATKLAGDWTAISIRNGSGLVPVVSGNATPSARFAASKVTGTGGVNMFHATYQTTGADQIAITLGAMTKMAGSPAMMAQENAYLSALADAHHYRIRSDTLELLDDSGATVVKYARAIPLTLEDNLWTCRGYNNGKQAVVSLVPSSTITIRFGTDGRLTGSGGVNQYATSFTKSGSTMKIDQVMITTRAVGTKDLMAQEKAYLSALGQTARYEIDGTTLTLWGGDTMGRAATYELAKP